MHDLDTPVDNLRRSFMLATINTHIPCKVKSSNVQQP